MPLKEISCGSAVSQRHVEDSSKQVPRIRILAWSFK